MKRPSELKWPCIWVLSRFGTILLCCLLSSMKTASGQALCPDRVPRTLDSIALETNRLGNTPKKLAYLFCCVDSLQYRTPEMALQLCTKIDTLAKQAGIIPALAQSQYRQAWLRYHELRKTTLDSAMTNAQISETLYRQVDDPYWLARAYGLLAAISLGQKAVEEAKRYVGEAEANILKIKGQKKDSLWVSAYMDILQSTMPGNDLPTVRATLENAREKYLQVDDPAGAARACTNLAFACRDSGAPEAVVHAYFQEALDYYERCGAQNGLASVYIPWGGYYTLLFEIDSSRRDCFRQAVKCLRKAAAIHPNFAVYNQLGATYHFKAATLSNRSPLFAMYVDSTRQFYEKAIAIAVLDESTDNLQVLVDNIASLCGQTGNCDAWLSKVSLAYQQIFSQTRTEAANAKDQLIDFGKEQSRLRQRNLRISAGLVLLALTIVFLVVFFQMRVRSLNRELQAQLKMLQAQLNPHFVSNCMNAIVNLINQKHLIEANGYIVKFTRLCRNLLEHSDDTQVSLKKEIETLRYYLDLEKLRLREQLVYEIITDPDIDQEVVKIPLMLVQPFAENAIWHGIQQKATPGKLTLSFQREGKKQLKLTIEDNGIGRKRAQEIQSGHVREHQSKGMQIARKRIEYIQQMKGAAFEISDVWPKAEDTGTRVTIRIRV